MEIVAAWTRNRQKAHGITVSWALWQIFLWKAGKITATKAMELTGTKRTTFYKLLGA